MRASACRSLYRSENRGTRGLAESSAIISVGQMATSSARKRKLMNQCEYQQSMFVHKRAKGLLVDWDLAVAPIPPIVHCSLNAAVLPYRHQCSTRRRVCTSERNAARIYDWQRPRRHRYAFHTACMPAFSQQQHFRVQDSQQGMKKGKIVCLAGGGSTCRVCLYHLGLSDGPLRAVRHNP